MEHLKFLALRRVLHECGVAIDPEEAAIKVAKVIESYYDNWVCPWPF